jgi:hypothetical protein
MADEWRVEVELTDEGHGLTVGDRLRSLDLDDEAKERLGGRVVVTREGSKMFLYAGSEAGAREAERVLRDLVAEEGLAARTELTHWDPGDHEWEEISRQAADHHAAEREDAEQSDALPHPAFVVLGAHRPQILRDLGL